jgi:hypothetical protein
LAASSFRRRPSSRAEGTFRLRALGLWWSILDRLILPRALRTKSGSDGEKSEMLTSAECRAMAESKLAEAERDDSHRARLITAAEAWLFLAGQLRRAEAALAEHSIDAKRHSKKRTGKAR